MGDVSLTPSFHGMLTLVQNDILQHVFNSKKQIIIIPVDLNFCEYVCVM